MATSFAIFLDAGFVKRKLRKPKSPPVSAAQVQNLIEDIKAHPYLKDMFLHRAYFYDARPLEEEVIHPAGIQVDFGKSTMARLSRTMHQELEEIPFLSLRFGELSFNGFKYTHKALKPGEEHVSFPLAITPDELKADVQQKGVDMRIGLDMASLTLKEHVKVIALVTGDSDFIPAMKFARREGAQVILFTLGHGIKRGLVEHADLVVREPADALPK